MSAPPEYIKNPNTLRCFDINEVQYSVMPSWLTSWQQELYSSNFKLSSRHEEALARLIPLLLCGEQSAIHVFGSEIERLRGNTWAKSVSLLKEIEIDEHAHEKALQVLSSILMEPTDLRNIKRNARHFYLRLGNTAGVAEHFAQVAQLDACVCIIMNAITKSDLGREHLIAKLFDRIKQDEARHVSVSKKHFYYLGGNRILLSENKSSVSQKLVALLRTEANSFETLGIDPDALFSKLLNARQQ